MLSLDGSGEGEAWESTESLSFYGRRTPFRGGKATFVIMKLKETYDREKKTISSASLKLLW